MTAAWIIAGLILFLLLVILLVLLSLKGNKNSEEILRKQSIVITELADEVVVLQEKVEKCCAGTKAAPAKKAPAKKAPAKKKPAAKKPAPKKVEEPKISKEEQAKRDAEREKLRKKIAKQNEGKKITAAALKAMKLTDLYGIGPKRDEYFQKNGIKDIVALSKKNPNTLTKAFIEGLPALTSWTPEMKKDAIVANIAEADFMVNDLVK